MTEKSRRRITTKRPGPEKLRRQKRQSAQEDARACIARLEKDGLVPKARRSYALFTSWYFQNSPTARAGTRALSFTRATLRWKNLGVEERQSFQNQSALEFRRRAQALRSHGLRVRTLGAEGLEEEPEGDETPASGAGQTAPGVGQTASKVGQAAPGDGLAAPTQPGEGSSPGYVEPERKPASWKGVKITMCGYEVHASADCLIGEGSFGSVYVGMHVQSHARVAVKLFHEGLGVEPTCEREAGFYKELAEYGAHAPFPRVYHVAGVDNEPLRCLVLELFDASIRDMCRADPIREVVRDAVVAHMDLAVDYLHRVVRVVHMDIKPSNILWKRVEGRAVLCDYGQAEKIGAAKPTFPHYTTQQYRAPELWVAAVGSDGLARSSDYWALGCTLWSFIVGRGEKNIRRQQSLLHAVDSNLQGLCAGSGAAAIQARAQQLLACEAEARGAFGASTVPTVTASPRRSIVCVLSAFDN
jgi:hypothetical protein